MNQRQLVKNRKGLSFLSSLLIEAGRKVDLLNQMATRRIIGTQL